MKYIIELPEEPLSILALSTIKGIPKATKVETFEPYTEPDRKAIEDEVWKFTGKIQKMTCEQMHEVLGITAPNYDYFCNEISYQEAKAKYEEWSKQNIREGDEVIYNSRTRAVVLKPETEEKYGTILTSEFATITVSHDDLEKTGRCFPEVVELLKKMRNTE